jgi:hypothetical protein
MNCVWVAGIEVGRGGLMLRAITATFFIIMILVISGCGSGYANSVQPSGPTTPTISSISPTSAVAGSPDLILTITGTNFFLGPKRGSQAVWGANGSDTFLGTTVLSSTQLTAVIPAALLSSPVKAAVFVFNGDPVDELLDSNAINFSVNASAASTVSPTLVTLGPTGTQQFVATINGNIADATWAIEEGEIGGSITSTGLYTVPAHVGTFHVIATFVADPSKSAAATVSVFASGFTETASMSEPRSGHAATLLADGRVLIVGGGVGGDASAELFDPSKGTFAPTGSMTTPRYGATATLLSSGKVLITGGFGPEDGSELYNPSIGTFSETGSMAVPRILHTATLLNNGKVLITGGMDRSAGDGAAVQSAELYDPSTGTFSLTGSMLTDRAQHTATLLHSGEVLIAGGWNGHLDDAADDPPWDPLFAELFDPSNGTFRSIGSMSTTRISHKAVSLSDGKVLMLGGIPIPQNIHEQLPAPAYAELYDPATGAFSPVTNVSLQQSGYTATLLTNGQVLIVGGEEANTAVTSAELIDAANATLVATGSLVTARKGHTATRLNDGRILVTGGTDNNGNALATAEVYR